LITMPLKFASLGSVTWAATEQVRATLEVTDGVGLAESLALAELEGSAVIRVALPEMLKPPMISARVATPEAAPMPTCLK